MFRSSTRSGITLIEVVFCLGLVVLLAGLSLWSLKPGQSKLSTHGLANAIKSEFESARQLAISTGRPVAVGIPTDGGSTPRATSLYRLEGWNKPLVTSSFDHKGDYPNLVFLAAQWPGPTFKDAPESSELAKFNIFDLEQWLPTQSAKDYIYCFTPDGGLVTNGLKTIDGRYPLVVAQNPAVGGAPPNQTVISGAESATTLLISPSGGIEIVAGLPNGPNAGGSAQAANSSQAQSRTLFGQAGATVKISQVIVLPNPDAAPPDQGVCVPGQVVTLEVYAYDPEGRALFSKWTQSSLGTPNKLGQFSYPYSDKNPELAGEVDKMEFVYDIPDNVQWMDGGTLPEGVGAFRARWNWTVPVNSEPGEQYVVQADVRDVKGEVYIENPPAKTFVTPPAGRLLVERYTQPNGPWQLVTLNPDGSGEKVLSPKGVEEVMPSLDRTGTKMAFLQGTFPNRFVKIRGLVDGSEELTVAGPGPFTSVSISPDGAWVSYRSQVDQDNQTLFTTKLDGTETYSDDQTFNLGTGHTIKKSRTGWSQDSQYMLFEGGDENDNLIMTRNLKTGGTPTRLFTQQFHNSAPSYNGSETPYAPTTYMTSSGERILLSLGNNNPVLISLAINQNNFENGGLVPGDLYTDYPAAATGNKLRVDYGPNPPEGSDNDYPNISADGAFLTWTRSPQTSGMHIPGSITEDTEDQQVWIVPRDQDNFIQGPNGPTVMAADDVRRATWLPTATQD